MAAPSLQRRRATGFSLIELMIVLAVMAILASIAYPSYAAQIAKSRRADALVALYRVQQAQERWRANHTRYAQSLAQLGLPAGDSGRYTLAISAGAAHGYTVLASTVDARSDRACTALSLSVQSGQTLYGSTGEATARSCWNR